MSDFENAQFAMCTARGWKGSRLAEAAALSRERLLIQRSKAEDTIGAAWFKRCNWHQGARRIKS